MNTLENIIFDLGGVVINLDRQRAVDALSNLGIKDADILLGTYAQKGPFLMLETGEITASQIFDLLLPQCKPGTTCTDLRDAFEEFLLDIPKERLELLRRLKQHYNLFVLSNTNPIMYNHWIDNAFRQEGKTINDYFDGIVLSYQEKMCKPDPRIFQTVVDRYRLFPDNTLMLDDSQANCDSAVSVGLKAIQVKPEGPNSFEEICDAILHQDLSLC